MQNTNIVTYSMKKIKEVKGKKNSKGMLSFSWVHRTYKPR